MAMRRFVCFVVCLLLFGCSSSVRADDAGCYTSGSVAGIVIATVVVTLVMGGLAAAFIWYLWKQRKLSYEDNKSMEKPIVCPPMSPDKQMIVRESNDYAFDNPYFKDDETDTPNPDAAEKGESGFRADNGDIASTQNAKASNGTTGNHHQQHKKSRPFSSLPFHSVFHPSGKRTQKGTMDDIYISKHLERITVPLRGHDFTGLGFNVCGNMRDGIFVKDVLHRGPASESGKIKAGDRIVSVTVSFCAMVYEDALTILSYASPYDVKLEIEKAPVGALPGAPHLPTSSPKRLGTSTSFRSNGQRRLFHPLYRSQSIDDLTQIGKDGFGVNTSGSQRDSSSSATPKRSQSVEASNGGLKTRVPLVLNKSEGSKSSSSKGSRKSSTSSCESTAKAVTPTEKSQPDVFLEEVPCTKKETKSARFRAEQTHVKSEATQKVVPPTKPTSELPDDSKQQPENDTPDKPVVITALIPSSETAVAESSNTIVPQSDSFTNDAPEAATSADLDVEKPTVPPRKINTPKRRAPAPPPIHSISKTEETSAIVHRVDDLHPEQKVNEQEISFQVKSPETPPPPPISELPPVADGILPLPDETLAKSDELRASVEELKKLQLLSSGDKMQPDPGMVSSNSSSLASTDHSSSKIDKDEQNASPGKRKASSLGDLTKLEHGANNKMSTSSAILERAVSLDFQQSLPGESLTRQKKILRAPTFEDNYQEDREDLSEINSAGLKRWDNGLDQVFSNLANGDGELNYHLKNSDEEDFVSSEHDVKIAVKIETNKTDAVDKLDTELITESTTEKPAADLENDSPVGELPLPNADDFTTLLTSTPVKKVIEVKNLKDDSDDDDVPYLASIKQVVREETSSKNASKTTPSGSAALFSPVTISIPVIKPDLTHYEKLPSPPPASTHPSLDPGWRMTKTVTSDENNKTSLERISVQSLYRPIFASKEINSGDEPAVENNSSERMVNGNESDTSEHYSTAQENTSTSSIETSTLSVTVSKPVIKEVTTIKAPNTIAGFAKTLIIPGPNEVENLLSLAAEPNTPPPLLEPPSKPVEKE